FGILRGGVVDGCRALSDVLGRYGGLHILIPENLSAKGGHEGEVSDLRLVLSGRLQGQSQEAAVRALDNRDGGSSDLPEEARRRHILLLRNAIVEAGRKPARERGMRVDFDVVRRLESLGVALDVGQPNGIAHELTGLRHLLLVELIQRAESTALQIAELCPARVCIVIAREPIAGEGHRPRVPRDRRKRARDACAEAISDLLVPQAESVVLVHHPGEAVRETLDAAASTEAMLLHEAGLVEDVGGLLVEQEVLRALHPAEARFVGEIRSTRQAAFREDLQDAVGRIRAVERRRCTALRELDPLYVLARDVRNRA